MHGLAEMEHFFLKELEPLPLTLLACLLFTSGEASFSLSTSSFFYLTNFKIFYARPYQHGKPSFPPFEVHLSDQLPESPERGLKAHYFFIHGLFFD
jgi:hypothetical protein